jgi:alkylhydroperoxidase family enzyme
LRRDPTKADLSTADKAIVDFVIRLTKAAYKLMPEDIAKLRSVGFDDVGILQITLIASWFNYINRVADALGVGRPGP